MKNVIHNIYSFILLFLLLPHLHAQTNIQGRVFDEVSGQTLVGARIYIDGDQEAIGTISNNEGYFELELDHEPPFELLFSLFGFESKHLIIQEKEQFLEIYLQELIEGNQQILVTALKGEDEVQAASRKLERKIESPVSVYSLGVIELNQSPYVDYFQELSNLREIYLNTSSLTLTSVNTRGFSDIQNWRFVQYIDGIEMNTPGLNFALGNMLGSSILDIRNIEVVPGAGSALYGANAFNGILSMETKNPFDYTGLSIFTSAGLNRQEASGTQPFINSGIRYATQINPKWAFKINFSTLFAHDWEANDESYHLRPEAINQKDNLNALPRTHPNFDAVHVYGDEVTVGVDLNDDGTLIPINRSGFREQDIVDYGIDNYQVNAALHFKPKEDLEFSYAFRYLNGDAIMRHTTAYPFVNTTSNIHKLELRGEAFFLRGYLSTEDAKDSYQMLTTGAFIQEGLKSSEQWSIDYAKAFQGEIPGVSSDDHQAAREYADRDIPQPGSIPFERMKLTTLGNPNITQGGSKFVDQSSMFHLDGGYQWDDLLGSANLQIGGSFRSYRLNSNGQLFNDGEQGYDSPINYNDLGFFTQLSYPFLQNRLVLNATIRYDKNSNFKGRFTPRMSGVLTLGPRRNHNIRASIQQGFRNPASQEGYIALDLNRLFLIGGLADNLDNFRYESPDGTVYSGTEISQNLTTLTSFIAFQQSGFSDPTLLKSQEYTPLVQEKLLTWEIGYTGQITERISFDANLYINRYQNFVKRTNAFSTLTNRVFSIYTNVSETINSYGLGFGTEYLFARNYQMEFNYQFSSYDADEAVEENPDFLPGFNTPKHQIKWQLTNPKIYKQLGFNLNYRWSDDYIWESPFGQGKIDSYGVADAAILYNFRQLHTRIKLGVSNLLGNEYRTIYGGPSIGSQYFITLIYDKY